MVGPKGIWVFEVKYWSGEITWQNGRWSRKKAYYETGRIPVEETIEVNQPPDQQWRRMVDEVTKILRQQARQLVFTTPDLVKIQGGLVFTHPKATYHIPRQGLFFEWGDSAFWAEQLKTAPLVADLSERKILQVVEVLLARHQELNKSNFATYSMVARAEQLIQEAETKLGAWARER